MKKLIYSLSIVAFLGVLCFTSQSCDKVKDAIAKNLDPFNYNPDPIQFTIPIVTSTQDYQTNSDSTIINVNKLIQDNAGTNFSIDNISAITITKVTLHMDNPDATNNWTNLENAALLFATDKSNNNNTPSIISSYNIDDISANQQQDIVLNSNINLKDFFNGGDTKVYYLTAYKARRATTKELKITATLEYTLTP